MAALLYVMYILFVLEDLIAMPFSVSNARTIKYRNIEILEGNSLSC